MNKVLSKFTLLFLLLTFTLSAQSIQWQNLDTVKAQRFDTGTMWTFDYPPVAYWKEAYGFTATQEWLDKARLGSVRLSTGCSSSFVSDDGLIMTNHHCVDQVLGRFQRPGEDIHKTGFFAATLADERKIPGVFLDQLIKMIDITKPMVDALNSGKTTEEKTKLRNDKRNELLAKYRAENPGMKCQIVQFYNGGKYSMYIYKTYNDIRAVYMNEADMGLFGGDPDNFTYPRYNPDFAFVRVYDEAGKPLKPTTFFKFSDQAPKSGEPLFEIGNPGRTQRLKTVAQLEYIRDITYPNIVASLKVQTKILYEMAKLHPDRAAQYNNQAFFTGNSAKFFGGSLDGLRDPMLIARKKDFEKKFKDAVLANAELNSKYGHLWEGITDTRNELRKFGLEMAAYQVADCIYFRMGNWIYNLAKKGPLPKGADLEAQFKKDFPNPLDKEIQEKLLKLHIDNVVMNLGKNHQLVKKIFESKTGLDAVKYLLNKSTIISVDGLMKLAAQGSQAVLNSDDPFIAFSRETADKLDEMRKKAAEITRTESVMEEELGQAFFAVYGTSIPPDATFTLRISDGVMKKYEYNGTLAPEFTTFYGLYDRYYSHRQEYPWDLPARWANPLRGLDLSAPLNFLSTNDSVGGNSGSPIVNSKLEVVGLAFDGNVESLPGDFILDSNFNRCISVSSAGILQVLTNITNAKRLSDELKAGKIVN